jgi:hypothetical protein
MSSLKPLRHPDNIHELIQTTFDADLPLVGGWGYSQEEATIVKSLPDNMPIFQLEHMITTIRAHLEMNIMQEALDRYAGINANEKYREKITTPLAVFDKVTYEVTGIKEDLYHAFIKEYKAGYDDASLDLNAHFKRRKESTFIREMVHYFEVSTLN